MFDFKSLLEGTASAISIAAALNQVDAERRRAEADIQAFSDERSDKLLDGDKAEIQKNAEKLEGRRLDLERLNLGRERLEERLKDAQKREAQETLDQWFSLAESAAEEGAKLIGRYEKLAREIRGVLIEVSAHDEVVRRGNVKLKDGKDARRVGLVDDSMNISDRGYSRSGLAGSVKLPSTRMGETSIWVLGAGSVGAPASSGDSLQIATTIAARVDEIVGATINSPDAVATSIERT